MTAKETASSRSHGRPCESLELARAASASTAEAAEGTLDPEPRGPDSTPLEDDEAGSEAAEGGEGPPTPWIPLFLYLTAVLFYVMYEIGGDLDKRMPHRTAWLFVPVFLYLAVAGVATGRMPLRGEPVARQKSPRAFWALASLYLALALTMAVVGMGVFEN